MIIIGAGLSGLIAGALDRGAMLVEAAPSLPNNHHAVLRFRTERIGEALGIPFRRVRVMKAISRDGVLSSVTTPRDANEYSRKVVGVVTGRSVINLEPAERFIAPGDLVARLGVLCAGRVEFGVRVDADWLRAADRPIVSTVPMGHMIEWLYGAHEAAPQFQYEPITVLKFRVPGADAHQSIYFPSLATHMYRATLTGDELMLEAVRGAINQRDIVEASHGFGLDPGQLEPLAPARQRYGKILPLPSDIRRQWLSRITREHGVFSLGRYATWRNVLLDDVYEDWLRIRKMIDLDAYGHALSLTNLGAGT